MAFAGRSPTLLPISLLWVIVFSGRNPGNRKMEGRFKTSVCHCCFENIIPPFLSLVPE
jgi:hypothetical protein